MCIYTAPGGEIHCMMGKSEGQTVPSRRSSRKRKQTEDLAVHPNPADFDGNKIVSTWKSSKKLTNVGDTKDRGKACVKSTGKKMVAKKQTVAKSPGADLTQVEDGNFNKSDALTNLKETVLESRSLLPELDFSGRRCILDMRVCPLPGVNSTNIAHHLHNLSLGKRTSNTPKKLGAPVASILSDMQLYRTASPFDRRVTAMEWHPTNPHIVAAGSKGGDIILWNIESANQDLFMSGIGPGGSIQAMKFWPDDDRRLLTASIDGRVTLHDVQGKKSSVISDTMNCMNNWYCSVDVNRQKTIIAGDNIGNTLLLTKEGEKGWSHRLHKKKVTHVEWSPREEWLFLTASCDQTVRFWDVRMVGGAHSSLVDLKHNRPINSAYFSLTDGCRVLTTDQKDEIRVYSAPSWRLEQTISHPHRFFQHITPFKAHWHPLQDLAVIGRYPDASFQENDSRSIDVYDESGDLVCQLQDQSATGLISLNRFGLQGDCLASAMGCNILIWSRKEEVIKRHELLLAEMKKNVINAGLVQARGQGRTGSRSTGSKQTMAKKSTTKAKNDTKTNLKAKQTKR